MKTLGIDSASILTAETLHCRRAALQTEMKQNFGPTAEWKFQLSDSWGAGASFLRNL